MLNLAKVICLLLVATATSGIELSRLSSARESFTREKNSSTMKIEEAYKNAKTTVDTLVSQMELQIPYRPSCSNNGGNPNKEECPSAECFQLFKELTANNMEGRGECSQKHLELLKAQQVLLGNIRTEMLKLLEDEKHVAQTCVSAYSNNFFGKVLAARCIRKAERNLRGTVKRAESEFSAVQRNAQKVASLWVPDIAYCLAAAEDPMLMAEWEKLCNAGKPSGDQNL